MFAVLLDFLLYIFIIIRYGLSLAALMYCILISLLTVISINDIDKFIIPDKYILCIFLLGVLSILLDKSALVSKLIGMSAGFLIFMIIALLTNAMGGGDIKLMAVLGLMFGIDGILFITLFSFVFGAFVSIFFMKYKLKNKNDEIPFTPFIASAALLYIFFGKEILSLYLNIIII